MCEALRTFVGEDPVCNSLEKKVSHIETNLIFVSSGLLALNRRLCLQPIALIMNGCRQDITFYSIDNNSETWNFAIFL